MDSKSVSTAPRRVGRASVPRIHRLGRAYASWGHAPRAEEIDAIGIIAALRLAGRRALAQIAVTPDLVVVWTATTTG